MQGRKVRALPTPNVKITSQAPKTIKLSEETKELNIYVYIYLESFSLLSPQVRDLCMLTGR